MDLIADVKLKKVLSRFVKFALIMAIVSLASGVFYREFYRPFVKGLSFDVMERVVHSLGLTHGHTLVLGFIVPILLVFCTFFFKSSITEKKVKSINIAIVIYICGTVLSLLLMFFKGISIIVIFDRTKDFITLDEQLFFGNVIVRSLAYSIAHITYGVGFIWYTLSLFRTKLVIK